MHGEGTAGHDQSYGDATEETQRPLDQAAYSHVRSGPPGVRSVQTGGRNLRDKEPLGVNYGTLYLNLYFHLTTT